jgi:hypothetical protein
VLNIINIYKSGNVMDEDLNPKVKGEGFKSSLLQPMILWPLKLSQVALFKLFGLRV